MAPSNQDSLDDMLTVPEIQKRYSPDCDHFHQLGAQCVVITLGHRGVLASYLEPPDVNGNQGQRTFFCPAKKKEPQPVDETGASDAFIGAYAVEIVRQMTTRGSATLDIGAAIEHGIKAGGLTTGKFGSFLAIPWRPEWDGEDVQWLTANPFQST
ncbi:hypothetical protein FSARC_2773 [Fusarium sarcochroum]|uniref:Carbohydrate kinase PfkB domain-containing protein n=1 Tax=Fusarium sarcochroum TaxID=1208366 RepID=A0A8H4U5F0_9HYPO|nr:hypothetical protein FSARC_2773 [Fusarium sarcochroum]